MKKIHVLLLIHIVWASSMFGQIAGEGRISGKLVDKNTREAILQANIRVLNNDSTFVTGVASGANGKFSIPIRYGAYIVHISFIGYVDVYANIRVSAEKPKIDMATIEMKDNPILLSEAVVTAKAAEIRIKGDTLEYNADSYKVTESAVVEDLLKKMPGVEVDAQGKITVNGREIKKILVDGEEFFSNDPKVASKNLPAKMVERLQVLDRRTDLSQMTGFDDGEEETVINLTVRPGMKQGLLGNAFAGYGSKNRYEANAMVNSMKNKDQYTFLGGLNNTNNAGFSDFSSSLFQGLGGRRGRRGGLGNQDGITRSANGGLNFSKTFSDAFKWGGNIRYGYTDNNTTSRVFTQNLISAGNTFENETNMRHAINHNFNMDFRMEWEPDTLTKIIFSPGASLYKNKRTESGEFITVDEKDAPINNGDSKYASDGTGKNMNARLEVSRRLSKPGRVLSMQLRGGLDDSQNSGSSSSLTFYNGSRPDDVIDQEFTNANTSKNWRGYISYVEPVGRNNFMQVAYNFRRNVSKSDKDTRSKDAAGNYTVLDSAYSKRLENDFINQEIELNFRSVREKYDYTLGFSVQPSRSVSKTFIGEKKIIPDLRQDVINYAPMAQFNYRWSRQHNLRIRYYGETNQPTVQQLSPVVDVSDPLNITVGNPDLSPSFQHQLRVRYQNFNPEKNRSFMFFGNGGYLTNDIVSSTLTDRVTGRKETTFENVGGNWNANGRFIMNLPLKNIKFSVFSMSFAGYNHTNGFSNNEANLNKRLNLMQALGLNYRSEAFDFSLRGSTGYNSVKNSLDGQRNQTYYDYRTHASTTIYLPYDFSIESDVSYNTNSGYADGYRQNEWLWNAAIQKQIFKQKNGTVRFKIYDILQQRTNISRTATSNYIRDTTTNTLTSYFMFHFVYRFNIFKGGATREDMDSQQPRFGRRLHE